MDITEIQSILSTKISAQVTPDGQHKLASVLVIIYGSDPKIIMTEKPEHLNIHAGEIAFPGGKWEEDDCDMLDTALRETREEIGISISRDNVIGQLDPVKTLNSGFKIIPFISILDGIPKLQSNVEVEQILHIPLFPFLETMADDNDAKHNSILEMYTFQYEENTVWGASARILKQIVNQFSKNGII